MDENRIQLQAEESGERIDALLARSFPALSRSLIQRCMEEGAVTADGRAVKKNARARAGALIELALPETEELPLVPQELPLDVVYEDADLIVVNKARGMVVHPAPGHPDSTLVNALLFHCGDSLSGIGGCRRPGIVHRIDKDTSGLLVAAKTDLAHQGLSAQLGDHSRCWRATAATACSAAVWRPDAPTRSASTWPASATLCSATGSTGRSVPTGDSRASACTRAG